MSGEKQFLQHQTVALGDRRSATCDDLTRQWLSTMMPPPTKKINWISKMKTWGSGAARADDGDQQLAEQMWRERAMATRLHCQRSSSPPGT